ncbi:MAG: gluconate 2-dehydrogenase subunit 3 family protein [Halolamina sp.]|uniref:gluconate 2-dehydrogenase subunit 3 family protein n=1 Tax=Halolamina sp. TaxID=1940283 RepID=UPI002FC33D55
MELTRRDALAALSAVTSGAVAGCSAPTDEYGEPKTAADGPELGEAEIQTLVALAAVLYPSQTENVEGFVEEYAVERVGRDPDHGRGVVDAIGYLNEYAQTIYGERYAVLPASKREAALDEIPVDTVDPVPDGTEPQQLRYFLINDLLYAFYATPTGSSLAGLANPPGYPGGTSSYQRGPQ